MADENGSVEAGNPDGGAAAVPGTGGGESVAANWTDGFDDDTRSFVETKGWQGPQDVVSSYRNAEKLIGNRADALTVPGEDATPDDWNKFYARTGRPESPEDYAFNMPEGLPENFAYSDDLAKGMKAWAHEAGLSPKQAQALHDGYVKHVAGQQQAAMIERQQQFQKVDGALRQKYGQDYDGKTELAFRAAQTLGGDTLTALMEETGLGNNPIIVEAFIKAGEMLGEDSLAGGGDASVSTAQADIARMTEDKAFLAKLTDRDAPGHEAAVRQWQAAHEKAYG